MQRHDSSSSSESNFKLLKDTLRRPGQEVDPPKHVLAELREKLNPKSQSRDLTFFGGQPVSLNKTQLNSKIFNFEVIERDGARDLKEMDFIICEKTDGVRYILIVTSEGDHYFMARLTTKENRPIFYQASVMVAHNYQNINANQSKKSFNSVVEILDGQLCIDSYKNEHDQQVHVIKYLVFDILVHHRTLIINLPLAERLEYADLFVKGNNFALKWCQPPNEEELLIEIQLKDFLEISRDKSSNPDARTIEFMFKSYIPCLPHENDGIIFNNKTKEYVLGTNEGYLKWKPLELNTVDFLAVPNNKMELEDHDYKILDLYLSQYDNQTGSYTQLFAGFLAVPESTFDKIQKRREQKIQQTGEFVKGVVVECNFIKQQERVQNIYKKLYSIKNTGNITENMMYQRTDEVQQKRITRLQSQIFDKYWNFLKCRDDRSFGNNAAVADNIEKTIAEDITQDELIKMSNNYFKKVAEMRRRPGNRRG